MVLRFRQLASIPLGSYRKSMLHRIAVAPKTADPRARNFFQTLRARFPALSLDSVAVSQCYTVDANLTDNDVRLAAQCLTNALIESYAAGGVLEPEDFVYGIEIGFLPGVTDNVGKTARQTVEDALGRKFKNGEAVYSSKWFFLTGALSRDDAKKISEELHNSLIERVRICSAEEVRSGVSIIAPKVKLHGDVKVHDVNLNLPDSELEKIGKFGIPIRSEENTQEGAFRQGPLALSLHAMQTIRDYFKKEGRNPTDIELEAIAQTWSEHCKHTIFADPLDEVPEGIYRRYIKGATEKIRKQKGKKDLCVSVFKDNSGAIRFDNDYLLTHKVETHNAPSALDPFGGSITAIVGVNRDCLGFGLGAKPIANTFGFCVAPPDEEEPLFRDSELSQPLLPPRRILEGVVAGINAGGNESGIPTPLGFIAVDASYRGKPLVFGGTVGLIPRRTGKRKLYEKRARSGDYIVMIGGRVGLDGIHGATFSSESLSKGSPATAVQIGDPITQKKLSDALIREARDAGLYDSITDNGAGGLSGSVGETAKESGGCIVDLDLVPLKYPGLSPWQIWISESQERMTLAVPKRKWSKLKKIFERHDVEATRIGTFTESGRCVVRYKRKKVMDVSMRFLHGGRPIEHRKSVKPKTTTDAVPPAPADLKTTILNILRRPSVGSIAFISNQYDHEVQGSSVTKPLHGRGRVNADAAVLQPLPNSQKGVVLAQGLCPWYSAIDTYAMAAASIDTAVRNAVVAGANLEHLAILDNFCWSSSEKSERLYELKRAAEGCFDASVAYGTPFISGKDSMFNDFRGFDESGKMVHIAALPTILISAIGVVRDVSNAMTIDLKHDGDALYVVGETNEEIGASEYAYSCKMARGGTVPFVDYGKNRKAYNAVSRSIEEGLLSSAVGVGRGGFAAALAKSAIAGGRGAAVRLSALPGKAKKPHEQLFSESSGRILVSVRAGKESAFEGVMKAVPCAKIGKVSGKELAIDDIKIPLPEFSDAYRSYFKNW